MNSLALSMLEEAEPPRKAVVSESGYSIAVGGRELQSYEFDSKHFLNSYFAFVNRHNSNSLEPDPVVCQNLKALCATYF